MDAVDIYGHTPLFILAMYPNAANLACAERLIDLGANVDARDNGGSTPLYFVFQYGHLPTLNLLLKNGADPNLSNNLGETALTVAVRANRHGIMHALLAHGAKLSHHTLSGRSVLHEAAQYSDEKTLQLLASERIRGVRVEHRSSDGKTARDLARSRVDITEGWLVAFANLIASVDETVDASSPVPPPQTSLWFLFWCGPIPRVRLSDAIRVIENGAYDLTLWLYRVAVWLLQVQASVVFSVVVVLAALWYMVMR